MVVYGIICLVVGLSIGNKSNNKTDYDNVIIYDTIYNKVVLDSIKYKIHIKDSIIIELKNKVEYEMEQAINANNSNAVKQFYELAGAN